MAAWLGLVRVSRLGLGALVIASLVHTNAAGAPLFRVPEVLDVGRWEASPVQRSQSPTRLAVGDLNGDGLPDLVVSNLRTNAVPPAPGSIAVLLHHTSATTTALYKPCVNYQSPFESYDVQLADINKDGKLDAIVQSGFGTPAAGFAVMLGNGSGAIGSPTPYPLSGTRFVYIADVNGDTWPDVVVDVGTGSRVYLGTGGGALSGPAAYSIVPGYVGDVHGDGYADIVTFSGSTFTVYPGSPAGTFASSLGPFALGISPTNDQLRGVGFANMNADGVPDMVFGWAEGWQEPGPVGHVSVALGVAGGTYQAPVHYGVVHVPMQLRLGDVDGDGAIDVVTTRPGEMSASVCVKKGNGDGTLGFPTLVPGPRNMTDPVLVDLDQDSRLDLAFVLNENDNSGGPHKVGFIRNNGAGGFHSATLSTTPAANPFLKALADFNRDAKPDLAMSDGTVLRIADGDGDGNFSPGDWFTASAILTSFSPGDIDQDGDMDIIVGIGTSLNKCLGNGAGLMEPPTTILGFSGSAFRRSVADFTRDGRPDIVAASTSHGLAVLVQDATGNFANLTAMSFPAVPVQDLLVEDMNRDGVPDVVVATGSGLGISLGVVGGPGVILGTGVWVMMGRPYSAVCHGDFNKDGILDMAARESADALPYDRGIDVFLGTGTGSFTLHLTLPTLERRGHSIEAADFNRDGATDIITQGIVFPFDFEPDGSAEIFLGNGSGSFIRDMHSADYFVGAMNPSYGPFVVGDANRDRSPDVIAAVQTESEYNISALASNPRLIGNGLQPTMFTPTLNNASRVAVGDLNRDGKPDVVASAYGVATGIAVHLGNGSGGLGATTPLAQSTITYQIGLADFNRDGILDIASLTPAFTTLRVSTMLGVGDGTFGARNDYFFNAGFDFEIGDMNRDGIPDIVSATSDSIRVLLGTGAGTFTAGAGASVGFCWDLDLADLNRDGYLDVACATGNVKVVYGGPGGALGSPVTLAAPITTDQSLCIEDFNRDGFLDIVAHHSNTYYVLWGAASSPFSTFATSALTSAPLDMKVGEAEANGVPYVYATRSTEYLDLLSVSPAGAMAVVSTNIIGTSPQALALGDLNRDGGLDVISVGSSSHTVTVNLHGAGAIATGVVAAVPPVPRANLRQNYPNPFNPRTTIGYSLPRAERAQLAIHDVRGRRIAVLRDGFHPAGRHSVDWDGRDGVGRAVASGVYLYRLTTESGDSESRRMVVVK